MHWLRNARIADTDEERSYTAIAEKLVPVLYQALDTTKEKEAATIIAHIGWAGISQV